MPRKWRERELDPFQGLKPIVRIMQFAETPLGREGHPQDLVTDLWERASARGVRITYWMELVGGLFIRCA